MAGEAAAAPSTAAVQDMDTVRVEEEVQEGEVVAPLAVRQRVPVEVQRRINPEDTEWW